MLAARVVVSYGRKSLDWDSLEAAVVCLRNLEATGRILHHHHAAAVLRSDAIRIIDGKTSWKSMLFTCKAEALQHLLEKYHDMESTETRDRVYGLFGLLEYFGEADDDLPTIDYSMSISQVFDEVYRHVKVVCESTEVEAKLSLIQNLSALLRLPESNLAVQRARAEALPGINMKSCSQSHFAQWKRIVDGASCSSNIVGCSSKQH